MLVLFSPNRDLHTIRFRRLIFAMCIEVTSINLAASGGGAIRVQVTDNQGVVCLSYVQAPIYLCLSLSMSLSFSMSPSPPPFPTLSLPRGAMLSCLLAFSFTLSPVGCDVC
jgi:hypothetical protein